MASGETLGHAADKCGRADVPRLLRDLPAHVAADGGGRRKIATLVGWFAFFCTDDRVQPP